MSCPRLHHLSQCVPAQVGHPSSHSFPSISFYDWGVHLRSWATGISSTIIIIIWVAIILQTFSLSPSRWESVLKTGTETGREWVRLRDFQSCLKHSLFHRPGKLGRRCQCPISVAPSRRAFCEAARLWYVRRSSIGFFVNLIGRFIFELTARSVLEISKVKRTDPVCQQLDWDKVIYVKVNWVKSIWNSNKNAHMILVISRTWFLQADNSPSLIHEGILKKSRLRRFQ